MPTCDIREVTGLVLAGGRGSRMGGVDKGLQTLEGKPLVRHALDRLAPQVSVLMINANRNLEAYAGFGVALCTDADASFSGPLAGMLAGLVRCETEWLVTVPCDSPRFPLDLVSRLADGRREASIAVAVVNGPGGIRRQPVFCMLRRTLGAELASYLENGGRKIDTWFDRMGCVDVAFDDADAFFNANTVDELRVLGAG